MYNLYHDGQNSGTSRSVREHDVSYHSPIIIEIYAELSLQPGSLPFERFFDLVPKLRSFGFPVVERGEIPEDDPSSAVGSRAEMIRCWSEDRLRLVQIAQDTIVMNLVSPDGSYPGWRTFIDSLVTPALSVISSAVPECQPQSVSLSTIDRADIDRTPSFTLGDYLNCGGPRIPSILADTTIAFAYDAGQGVLAIDGFNRQLHISGGPARDAFIIHIHTVFQVRAGAVAEVIPTLEKLHSESNESFESLITERMRTEVMKGSATYVSSSL